MSDASEGRPRPSMIAVIAALVLGFVVGNAFVDRGDVKGAEKVLRENLEAVDREDRDAMIASFHPDSPFKAQAGALFDQLMPELDVSEELLGFEPIAASGDLLIARFVQRTEREGEGSTGGAFVDNEITGLAIFRLKDGTPRIWMTVPIEAREVTRTLAK